jgi:curved DNA-binding protein CbpA
MISNRDDPHAVLGVARTATPAEISHAYRDLLRRHHADTRTTEDHHGPEPPLHRRSPVDADQPLVAFLKALPREPW